MSTQWLSRQNNYAPWPSPGWNRCGHCVVGKIHYRNVIRRPVGRVESLRVRRESDAPRTLTHCHRTENGLSRRVDREDLLPAARADVQPGRVG